jgi:hypothetical protein
MITRQSKFLLAAGFVASLAGRAQAQVEADVEVYSAGPGAYAEDPNAPPEPYGPPPIPPDVEAQPQAGPGGAFCYNGPHPVDTRVAGGPAWDGSPGLHSHFYAPFDLRLFRLDGNCYSFIGDPQDFGYQGQVYSYYGAHPIQADYGGGWCFMVGGHHHWWQPWSTNFVVVNSWYYWNGPYDRVFWNYWPYYSYYYQSYYPHYYGGGRFMRRRDFHVAPRIQHIPEHYARGWRTAPGRGLVTTRPVGGGQWRGGAPGTVAPAPRHGSAVNGNWSASSGGWRGSSPAHAAPPPAPPRAAPPAHMPSTPLPTGGGWKGGSNAPSPGHAGSARGGWRH